MNKKLVLLGIVGALVMLFGVVLAVSAVSGAAYTTYNPWVDGDFKEVCKNSQINCNIYGTKPDVWLNGGPAANGLSPDGAYFFAVLVPGGQPNPNDGAPKNLSDNYDAYTNRTFTISGGEVSFYGGTHDQDSGATLNPARPFCATLHGCAPDGNPPFIRLFPYADTTNPGGVYILAICSLGRGYPVEPRDCKYDAFKVKEGAVTAEFMLKGMIFKDFLPNGPSAADHPRDGWQVHITGTGSAGESIDTTATTGLDGYWDFTKSYNFNKNSAVSSANLTVCVVMQAGGYQTYPLNNGCYTVTLNAAGVAFADNLDFGVWPTGLTRY
jgi:hypothetical protein